MGIKLFLLKTEAVPLCDVAGRLCFKNELGV